MNVRELIGKRCLLKVEGNRYGYRDSREVAEFKILEVAPSGQFVKVMNDYGNKFWKPLAAIALVEVLTTLEAPPDA